jgi:hypothetical protein
VELGIYKHYKGNLYQVIGIASHTETGEEMIVYQALYDKYQLWIRPKIMFCEQITYNNQNVYRFVFIGNPLKKVPIIQI